MSKKRHKSRWVGKGGYNRYLGEGDMYYKNTLYGINKKNENNSVLNEYGIFSILKYNSYPKCEYELWALGTSHL